MSLKAGLLKKQMQKEAFGGPGFYVYWLVLSQDKSSFSFQLCRCSLTVKQCPIFVCVIVNKQVRC